MLGTVQEVAPGMANDVLELDKGLALPLVEACVRESISTGGESWWRPDSHQVTNLPELCEDVFTWCRMPLPAVSEQRPVASVLGSELDLRLFNYRDWTPSPAARSTTSPTAVAPGWCFASTWSRPRSKASTAGFRSTA